MVGVIVVVLGALVGCRSSCCCLKIIPKFLGFKKGEDAKKSPNGPPYGWLLRQNLNAHLFPE